MSNSIETKTTHRGYKSKEPEQLDAELANLSLRTLSTEASTDSFDERLTPNPHFKRIGDSTSYQTPTNEVIDVSYASLGITPTNMLPFESVITSIENDGVWTYFCKEETGVFRMIVFLYGKCYYKDLYRDKRLERIAKCISIKGGNRKRLAQISLSSRTDKSFKKSGGFDLYFPMATTARMFFEMPNTVGGFPEEAYHRVQGSKNCYIVAVCMWLTLKLQRDNPGTVQQPIDVAQVGRRFVIDTVEKMEKRVIENKGDSSLQLLKGIIGQLEGLESVDFRFKNRCTDRCTDRCTGHRTAIVTACNMVKLQVYLDAGEVGLASQFHAGTSFLKCGRTSDDTSKHGYWKFDGNSIDCEGVFVSMEADEKVESEHARLSSIWNDQEQRKKEISDQHQLKIQNLVAHSPVQKKHFFSEDSVVEERQSSSSVRPTPAPAPGISSESVGGQHAMVVLGYHVEKVDDKEEKCMFMLWNWWQHMPLVLVSSEYLMACGCIVHFLPEKLTGSILSASRIEGLGCECSFPDLGEDTTSEDWTLFDVCEE